MIPIWPEPGSLLARRIADYVSMKIYGRAGKFPQSTALGVFNRDTLVAGIIYYDYDRDAAVIQISGAAENACWLTRPVLWEIFDFPFNQLECQAVVMRVDPDNQRLKRILMAYGFDKYVIPRLRGRHTSEAIYILGDDIWRRNGFHKGKTDGKKGGVSNSSTQDNCSKYGIEY